jgi:hypothetical protein
MSKKRSISVPNVPTYIKTQPIKIPIPLKSKYKSKRNTNTNRNNKIKKIIIEDFLNPEEIVKINKLEITRKRYFTKITEINEQIKELEKEKTKLFNNYILINEKIEKIIDPEEIFYFEEED